ncbi:MAG TPA: hypothetical protein VFU79_05695 [Nitrososphaeraceae archaeon]|nr:hypothetical protein [Nitrososphaeraceae archaeon]
MAIVKNKNQNQQTRFWLCDDCFNLRFLNDKTFADQILQVINLSREE